MSDAITLNGHARHVEAPAGGKKNKGVNVRFDAPGKTALVGRWKADAPGLDLAVYARQLIEAAIAGPTAADRRRKEIELLLLAMCPDIQTPEQASALYAQFVLGEEAA